MTQTDKEWILNNVYNERGKLNPRSSDRGWWEKKDKAEIYDAIMTHNTELEPTEKYAARVHCFLNDIVSHPNCEVCGRRTNYSACSRSFAAKCRLHALDDAAKVKRNETMVNKYGFVKNFSSEEHRAASTGIMIAKYGESDPMKLPETKEKIKTTSLRKYGEVSFTKTKSYRERSRATKLAKYGTENLWDLPEYRDRFTGENNGNYNREYENIEMIMEDIESGALTRTEICEKHNVSFSHLLKKLKSVGKDMSACKFEPIRKTSFAEQDIAEFLSKYARVESGNREILNGLELDVFLPERNFAVEYCGDYWHSYSTVDKKPYSPHRHQIKALRCIEKGVDLFTIYEHEWDNPEKKDIWLSKLEVKMGCARRIYARSCAILPVDHHVEKLFLQCNHLQGYCPSKIKLGLYFKGELVSLLTMGKSRYDKNYQYELLRFVSLKRTFRKSVYTHKYC